MLYPHPNHSEAKSQEVPQVESDLCQELARWRPVGKPPSLALSHQAAAWGNNDQGCKDDTKIIYCM